MLCTWPHCDWAQKIKPRFWEGHNIHFQANQVWVDYTMALQQDYTLALQQGPPSSDFKKSYQFKKMQLHIKTQEWEDCNKLSGTQNFPIPTYRPGAFFGQPRERFRDAHIPTPGDVAPKKTKKNTFIKWNQAKSDLLIQPLPHPRLLSPTSSRLYRQKMCLLISRNPKKSQ
jgi:hypothetical protein